MSTATYLKDGRGQSLRAIEAKDEGRFPASYWAKQLGQKITAADITSACGVGEWHHTGKYANRTAFYDAETIEESMAEILAARDARLAKGTRAGHATVKWTEFWKSGRRWQAEENEFTGQVSLKGDWVTFERATSYGTEIIKKSVKSNGFKSLTWLGGAQ